MKGRKFYALLAIIVAGFGWYLFRPERLFINQTVNESFPEAPAETNAAASSPMAILAGQFRGVAHETKGSATLFRLADGKRVLRFTDFMTSNGPDVQVYLVAANDAKDNDTVKKAGFIHLGALKGNQGDQNYDVPADADLTKHRAVTVWCRRFGVNFGTAPLRPAGESSTASEASGSSSPEPLYEGSFRGVAHDGKGQASIYKLADGRRVLRFTGFETSNGPDLQVYLVAAADAADSETVKKAGFVTLGALKGNKGDQNYDIPADADLNRHQAVTVWCRRFGVNFATAPLKQKGM